MTKLFNKIEEYTRVEEDARQHEADAAAPTSEAKPASNKRDPGAGTFSASKEAPRRMLPMKVTDAAGGATEAEGGKVETTGVNKGHGVKCMAREGASHAIAPPFRCSLKAWPGSVSMIRGRRW